jgi:(p)ppGpp synthase/HD superfamily hydrolase
VKKTGGLVIDHVRRVAEGVSREDEKMVAWLHDVVEKAPGWTTERLRQEGFSEAVVSAVDALTRRPGETSADLVRRAAASDLARPVKRADLADNLTAAGQAGQDVSRYHEGLRILATEFDT